MMNLDALQPQEAGELVSRAIALEKEIDTRKKVLERIKAKLQSLALAEMENKNLRYVRYDGTNGSFETCYKTKCEIDNFDRLASALAGSVALEDKVTRKEEVKYSLEGRFKKALIAFVKKEYAEHDLEKMLAGMGVEDANTRKVVLKKLKGDYEKDKALLASVGCTGSMEEELDAIREEKNRELVERFFEPDLIDHDEIRKSVYIEESLSVTLTAKKEEEGEG